MIEFSSEHGGALTGIGRATAFAFAKEGARLMVSGRRNEAGAKLAADLQVLGAEAEYDRADVRIEADVQNLVDETIKGCGRMDVAVNSAGTEGKPDPLIDQTAVSYTTTFETNVLGTFLGLKYELKAMIPQGFGSIINISSKLGQKTAPGASIYAATKHAVVGLTKTAALEAASANVRENAVAPCPIDPGMPDRFTVCAKKKAGLIAGVPLKRMERPEEVAQTILFLGLGQCAVHYRPDCRY